MRRTTADALLHVALMVLRLGEDEDGACLLPTETMEMTALSISSWDSDDAPLEFVAAPA